MIIALLRPVDYPSWLPLWHANMENSATPDITAETWRRICDPDFPVGGIGIRPDRDAPLAGICHYVLHYTTGNMNQVCYMQDLFIDPAFRRQGLGRKLVEYLAAHATAQNWARLYWLAEGKNEAAQTLYRSIGYKLDFTLHVLPTQSPAA